MSDLFRSLDRHGFSVGALHGDMDQRARMAMLHNFKENKIQLLVASDVAARGLDIPDVSHVFNFDVPIHAEDYVHRIGRTGRAGREGAAFTLVSKPETKYLQAIQTLIKTEIEWLSEIPESTGEDDDGQSGRGRGRRGAKSARGGRDNKREPKKERAPQERLPDAVAADETPAAEPKPKKKRGRKDEDNSPVPVGFGEDIPAFMMNGL